MVKIETNINLFFQLGSTIKTIQHLKYLHMKIKLLKKYYFTVTYS